MAAVWAAPTVPPGPRFRAMTSKSGELVLMCFLSHKSDTIGTQAAVAGGKLQFPVTLTRDNLVRSTTVTAIQGPSARWYVETIELRPVEAFCQKQPH